MPAQTVTASARSVQTLHSVAHEQSGIVASVWHDQDMGVAKYRSYRDYERQRVETNDTVMGLLVGSKLAAQNLGLHSDSTVLLSQAFPELDHVRRLNLRLNRAQDVLNDAEQLLGILAVPQVLALHESLFAGMLKMMDDASQPRTDLAVNAKTANIHERFEKGAGDTFTKSSVQLFHWVRIARNTHIHSGGKASKALQNQRVSLNETAEDDWWRITGGKLPTYDLGDPVSLGLQELIGILAIAKRLADEANNRLQTFLPRTAWAALAASDWKSTGFNGNHAQQLRKFRGFARANYRSLCFTDVELEQALQSN